MAHAGLPGPCPRQGHSTYGPSWAWVVAGLWQGGDRRAGRPGGGSCTTSCLAWTQLRRQQQQSPGWGPREQMVLPPLSRPSFPFGSPFSASCLVCFSSCTSSPPFPSRSLWPHLGQVGCIMWTSGCFLSAFSVPLFPATQPRPLPLPSLSLVVALVLTPPAFLLSSRVFFSCFLPRFTQWTGRT